MSVHFQGYDPHAPVRVYHRRLPHWRQDGATYFVTCRLADSLPDPLLVQLEQLRASLMSHDGNGTVVSQADREYFRVMEEHLDHGHGACWLKQPDVSALVSAAYKHFDGQRYELGEFCVMPNHTHMVVRPLSGHELEDILHSWKSFTAKQINTVVRHTGAVWQDESYDRLVRDSQELARTERYIRNNPLGQESRDPGW